MTSGPPPAQLEALRSAREAISHGRWDEAGAVLDAAFTGTPEWLELWCEALVLRSRVARNLGDLDYARALSTKAAEFADILKDGRLQAIAYESQGFVERESDHPQDAYALFRASAEAHPEDTEGSAVALSNAANALTNAHLPGAEELLTRALELAKPDGPGHASALDNMSLELGRLGRRREALKFSRRAVEAWEALGAWDIHEAKSNLLDRLFQNEDTAAAETLWDELVSTNREQQAAALDRQWYLDFSARVREYERVLRALDDGARVWDSLFESLLEASRLKEQRQTGAALELYEKLAIEWKRAGQPHYALLCAATVPSLLKANGEHRAAVERARAVVVEARELGDAVHESMMESEIASNRRTPTPTMLRSLARMEVLEEFLPAQREAFRIVSDGGSSAAALAGIYGYRGAQGHQMDALLRSLTAADDLTGEWRLRRLDRMYNLLLLYRAEGAHGKAEEWEQEVLRLATELAVDEPAATRVLTIVRAQVAARAGTATDELLSSLLDACRSYDEARIRAGTSAGYSVSNWDPYPQAAEAALLLDRLPLALALLQRSKARSFRPSQDHDEPATETLAPQLHQRTAVEWLLGEKATGVLVSSPTGVQWVSIPVSQVGELAGLLRVLGDESDTYRHERDASQDGLRAALDAVLASPEFARIAEGLAAVDGVATMAPQMFLHRAPLHLDPVALRLATFSFLPTTRADLADPRRGRAVICGDSQSNLPFARAEALLIPAKGARRAIGSKATHAWLTSAITSTRPAVLHLATHAAFSGEDPRDSGVMLAGGEFGDLMDISEMIALPLDGSLVVLSSCSSGLQATRGSEEGSGLVPALLEAGASTVVASRWPVDDLSGMLLMLGFYKHLRADLSDVLGAMDRSSTELRELSYAGLVELTGELATRLATASGKTAAVRFAAQAAAAAFRIVGWQTSAEQMDGIAKLPRRTTIADVLERTRELAAEPGLPFEHPKHWGAFAVFGDPR